MRSWMIAASLGIALVGCLPTLPGWYFAPGLFTLSLISVLLSRTAIPRALGALAFGVAWSVLQGHCLMHYTLLPQYEGKDIWLQGRVNGIPVSEHRGKQVVMRFELAVDGASLARVSRPADKVPALNETQGEALTEVPLRKVKLAWYGGEHVSPGQSWRFLVRLKRPRGFANPGGFDYQSWLLQQGVGATGYVRRHEGNQMLAAGSVFDAGVDGLRVKLGQRVAALLPRQAYAGIVKALMIGDKRDISADHWQLFSDTGTHHLVVISGLHIGLVAGLAYQLFFRLAAVSALAMRYLPATAYGAMAAMICAVAYAALAGFSVPTLRAVVMVAAIMLARLLKVDWPLPSALLIALFFVLVCQPLAIFSSGLWLSFGAVATLVYGLSARISNRGLWWRMVRPQWVVFCGMAPLLLMFFFQLSTISVLANFLAIPVVSFFVVPLCLLAVPAIALNESLAVFLLEAANTCLSVLFYTLQQLAQALGEWTLWTAHIGQWSTLVCLVAAVILLLAPRGIPSRYLALLLLAPLFLPRDTTPAEGTFTADILDVGQGLAVVVRTLNHVLVYDTGARFSARFDLGSAVVVPFLRSQGVHAIDRLVISHNDNDHRGGMQGLLNEMPVRELLYGEILPRDGRLNASSSVGVGTQCQQGSQWVWDGVLFEVLHPGVETWSRANNQSCVLLIRSIGLKPSGAAEFSAQLLLTGDIERRVEEQLSAKFGQSLHSGLLIAPHHGSKTSSSQDFIDVIQPRYVVFSAGYRNQFNHPHPDVVKRYTELGATMLNTAYTGHIHFELSPTGQITVARYRNRYRRFWRDNSIEKVR